MIIGPPEVDPPDVLGHYLHPIGVVVKIQWTNENTNGLPHTVHVDVVPPLGYMNYTYGNTQSIILNYAEYNTVYNVSITYTSTYCGQDSATTSVILKFGELSGIYLVWVTPPQEFMVKFTRQLYINREQFAKFNSCSTFSAMHKIINYNVVIHTNLGESFFYYS